MTEHDHEWIEARPWRICSRCLLVQSHDGKRWRKAPKAIQDYAHCLLALSFTHWIVTHPAVVARLSENVQRVLAIMTAPPGTAYEP